VETVVAWAAIQRPLAVILSEAKDLCSSFTVGAATCRRAQEKLQGFFASLRMTCVALRTKEKG
jgi:hypothetical protein